MGVLVRCDDCGALSWSLRAKPGDATPTTCTICGSELKIERRRPGRRRFRSDGRERRDLKSPAKPA
jgi:hypothetical protein